MRTVANIKGHPIHPMLVGFPITFLVSAFACDAVGRVLSDGRWWTMGAYLALAGIASALLAAAPGLIDYLYAVPPCSSARRHATYHLVVNLSAAGAFVTAWALRREPQSEPAWSVLALEGTGLALMTVGGWLGGTLVYRNFIGPEHRYASAGRWCEHWLTASPGAEVAVAHFDELGADQMKLLRINGKRIVLARTETGYTAFDDHCTHRGGSLADGVLICGKVQCLWHGSRFDVKTGRVENGPAQAPIATYPLRVREGKVYMTA